MKFTKEALEDLADRFSKGEHPPIPINDSNGKEIGTVTKVWYENGTLKYEGQLK